MEQTNRTELGQSNISCRSSQGGGGGLFSQIRCGNVCVNEMFIVVCSGVPSCVKC